MNTIRNGLAGATLALAATLAGATTYAGNLGDAGNAALVGSDLGAPDFTDENAIANNVALYTFTTLAGTVSIVSTGFAGGGVDPYFTLFSGSGATATLFDSNYVQATSTGGDFTWTGTLAAGTYEIALGSFENMSYAENPGGYTLGDGFSGLGDPNSLHDGSYALNLTTQVPEPSEALLLAVGLAALATRVRRSR
jgi:hypothetical protein